MVTRPSATRLPLVERAAAAFARQSYASRELLVVLDAAPAAERERCAAALGALGRADIRVIHADGAPSLGRLRNIGIEEARGELVCVWDDDDIHHPARIEAQVRALRANGVVATFLTDVFHLFVATRELYWTTYKRAEQHCVPGAGLYLRSIAARYPEQGAASQRGEDTVFCLRLFAEGAVHFVDDAPHLYTYVNHGANTSGDAFHHMVARTLSLSRGKIDRARHLVHEALDSAELGFDEINVMGSNGLAFVWARR
jgi:glycosyltransferase involved in cell wall biosynthesis